MSEEMEMICFQIITCAGAAKSSYIEAIRKTKEGMHEDAQQLIAEGDKMMSDGHKIHADLVQKEARGEASELSLLLVHAEDQMMSTEVFKVMAEEFIELYQKLNALQEG